MRRVLVTAVAVGGLLVASTPAQAATTIEIPSFSFNPATVKIVQGEDVRWHNATGIEHTSTQDAALSLWNTGVILGGGTSSSITIRAAGTYPYHCAIHATMHGVVKVPIKVAPSSGSTTTTFTITLTSATQTGFTSDVQRKVGDGAWKLWKSSVGTRTVTFSGVTGTYRFRSRLHRSSNDARSTWSPAKVITIA
jgi:plastocyanin